MKNELGSDEQRAIVLDGGVVVDRICRPLRANSLGAALGLASFGPRLSRSFRIVARVVAVLSVLGMLLMPALAE
jgi:hypothetical protein